MVSFLSSVIKWHFFDKRLCPLLLLFLSLLCFTCNGVVLAGFDDKSVLVQFKNSLSDPSGFLSNWNLENSNDSNHCTWFGVLCDSNSRVVSLNISGGGKQGNLSETDDGFQFSCSDYAQFPIEGFGIRRNCEGVRGKLSGKLLSAIADLTELRILSLPFNGLHGEISKEIWGMKNLEVLDLEGNLLNGSLPFSFPGLKKLRVLNLGFNRIAGEIPASFSDFESLEVLNLAGNQVNGTVPAFVGRLRGVYLSFNKLGGSVPSEIGENCGNLQHLDLSGNYLVGGIPQSLGMCFQLRSLLLNSNMLEEVIPAELGMLQNLEVLDVSRNSLSGPIPVEVGNCSKLTVLVLSNLFDPFGNVGSTRGDSPVEQSTSMNDNFNFFQGGFPEAVTSLPNLRILWAPRATLEGKLPSNWGTCDNLEMLNFGHNFFTGEIPGALGHCKKLHFLDLSSNQLTGELSEELPVPCTTLFDVSGNTLSGSIPTFHSRACHPVPYLRGNLFESYDPPTAYLSFLTNKAQAATPLSLLGGDNVLAIFHNFGVNNFTGSLPSMPIAPGRLGKQTAYAFFAGENKLSGPFPGHLFEQCDRLSTIMVNVSNNELSGQVPDDIGTMCKSLKFLDASGNQIVGPLPRGVGELMSLVALNLSWNFMHDQIPTSLGQIKSLKYLSLAGNKLTGSIPSSLGQLQLLEVLDLSSNSLTGVIPNDLENLRSLTALLLNNNNLSGKIPSGLANVSTLSAFNVSFNNLSGPLPLSTNLTKCNSVLGNPFLHPCQVFSLTVPSSDIQGAGDPQNSAAAPVGSPVSSGGHGFNSIEIASIASASAIVSVLLALIVLFFYTRRWNPHQTTQGVVIQMSGSREKRLVSGKPALPLVYEKEKYVDVWGGELWIDVLRSTLEYGLSPKSWTDYLYLSVGGTLSNAGISGQAFNHGPQISNVHELDVVTGKGELLTCSEEQNAELFHAVLGGLGQFGIITRARISLEPAPQRVRWIRVLYSNFSSFTEDQEYLISLHEQPASKKFDYVEGFVIVDEGLINNWRSSFFSPRNPVKITSLNADGGILYCLEVTKNYHESTADTVDQEVEALLKKLNFIQTSVFTTDLLYVDFLDRVHKAEMKLRSKGLWDVPHPWLNLFVPKSRIADFDKGVFKGILGNKTSGPILIYPMNNNRWDQSNSVVTPDEDVFYLVALLRSALDTGDEIHSLEYLSNQNRRILNFCDDAGIKVKQYLPHYTTQEEWMDHFGEKWGQFYERKLEFDPRHILATGQRIFRPSFTASTVAL